jgi:hypothetical protein
VLVRSDDDNTERPDAQEQVQIAVLLSRQDEWESAQRRLVESSQDACFHAYFPGVD